MRQQLLVNVLTGGAQRLDRPVQVDRVPEDDGRHHQIKAASTIALILEAAVMEFAEPVEEHRTCEHVLGFSLIQTVMHAATQLNVLHPVERKWRTLDAAEFTQ